MLICISREFGSGGHEIGQKMASALGYSFYDKYILSEGIKLSSISPQTREKADTILKAASSTVPSEISNPEEFSSKDATYQMMSAIIQRAATKNSCVYVGHCADEILKEAGIQRISLFIAAPLSDRVQRIMKLQNLEEKDAFDLVCRMDRQRKNYYNYYAGGGWGRPDHYDFCINSSTLGIEKTADVLLMLVRKIQTEKHS